MYLERKKQALSIFFRELKHSATRSIGQSPWRKEGKERWDRSGSFFGLVLNLPNFHFKKGQIITIKAKVIPEYTQQTKAYFNIIF